MIQMNWQNEDRSTTSSDYLNNRRGGRFVGGWTMQLDKPDPTRGKLDVVHWQGLGMVFASVLGNIPQTQKKQLYKLLLGLYLATDRVKHWTDEQRRRALQVADDY
jgi:hypothetical protein